MKKSRTTRFLSLFLSLVLFFSLCTPTLAADSPFSDIDSSHWAWDAVQACVDEGIVTGFQDGTFRPEDEVTYAQFIAMLARTFYSDEVNAVTDIAENPWYYPYMKVSRAHNLDFKTNIVNRGGWPEVAVANDPVNRYEMASILRMTMVAHSKSPRYEEWQTVTGSIKDYDQFPAKDDIQIYYLSVPCCYYAGVLTGMSDGKFHGEQTMTRVQACVVIMRMLKLINNYNPGDPDNDPSDDGKDQNNNQQANTLANGKPITEANVLAILDEIQQEYPYGTLWSGVDVAGNHYYANGGTANSDMANLTAKFKTASSNGTATTSLKYACGGWACMVTERIFGKTGYPFREVTDASKVRAGDVLITFNNNGLLKHVSIASSNAFVNDNGVYCFSTCDGNVTDANGIGHVKWYPGQAGTLTSNIRCFTRYPETESGNP